MTNYLRPVPLAFLFFPFSFALQVITWDERVGLIPYVLLSSVFVWMFVRSCLGAKGYGVRDTRNIDFFVAFLLAFTALHIVLGVLNSYDALTGARLFLIYVLSGGIYFYVSRHAKEREIRAILIAVCLAAVLVGVQWVHETFTKRIKLEVSEYQMKSFEYSMHRLGVDEDAMNHAGIGIGYRAYGLVENHVITGATVAIGAFAALSVFPAAGRRRRILLLLSFLLILSIGLATTALLAYMLLLPFVIAFADNRIRLGRVLTRLLCYAGLGLGLVLAIVLSNDWWRELLFVVVELFILQVSAIFNLDPEQGLSWLQLHVENAGIFLELVEKKPSLMLFGEGPLGWGGDYYPRGGDVAYWEIVATWGLPVALMFFAACAWAIFRAIKTLKQGVPVPQRMYLIFGFAVIAFLMISLGHYNTMFRKSILVCFFLALALVRRYGCPVCALKSDTTYNATQHWRATQGPGFESSERHPRK